MRVAPQPVPNNAQRTLTTPNTPPVCIIDDEFMMPETLQRLVESAGFKTLAFSEPQALLDHIAGNPVSVVLSDIWMEQMTGIELLAHISERSPKTRVIFITGYEDATAEFPIMRSGAFGFLLKPINPLKLIGLIHLALQMPFQAADEP